MYQIIKEPRALKQFISLLPNLRGNEVFFGALQTRNKYSSVSISDSQIGKIYGNKKSLYDKINKLQTPLGSYIDLKSNESIENEAMVMYMNYNPRCLVKAGLETQSLINANQKAILLGKNQKVLNPITAAYTAIQTSKGTGHVVDVDIDLVSKKSISILTMIELLDIHIGMLYVRSIIETRGGYHIQVNTIRLPEAIKKRWMVGLKKDLELIEGVKFDFSSDSMLPVVGCVQGDFIPMMIYFCDYGVVMGTGSFWDAIDKNIILDPDGFDRKDYHWSFHQELLTYGQFKLKQMLCTVLFNGDKKHNEKLHNKLTTMGESYNDINDLLNPCYEGVFQDFVNFRRRL